MVSALYGVPNDRRIVEAAREDVIAYMWNRLVWLVMAKDDGVPIAPYEQAWLDHLAGELQHKRIQDAHAALAEYDRWESDPCNFEPPDGYGFDPYDPICAGLGGQLQPPPPFAEQFTEYGAAIVNSQVFGDADVTAIWNKVAQVASLVATIGVAGLTAAIAANIVGATASTTGIFFKLFPHALKAGTEIFRSVAAGATGGLFAVIAIAAGVTAVGTWREIATQETLPKLQRRLATEQTTTPDLTPILDDVNVNTEAFGVLFAETLPSFDDERVLASTPRPHDPQRDPMLHRADGTSSATVATVDWDGRQQTTYLADGWFVTKSGNREYEWSPTLEYELPDGRNATATVNNSQFIVDVLPLNASLGTVTVQNGFADVTAVAGNRRPAVHVAVTDDLNEGSELTFEAETSDPDGDEVSVTWNLQPENSVVPCIDALTGEATPWVCAAPPLWPTLTGTTVSRTYLASGDYYGRVIVTDEHGASTEQRFGFRLRNVAPDVTIDPPASATEETGTASIGGTFSDAGGDTMSITIDWGDGTSSIRNYPCASPVAPDGSCSWVLGTTAQPTSWFATHVYDDPPPLGQAAYTVTVTATDGPSQVVRTVEQPVHPMPLNVVELAAADTAEGATMRVTGRINNPSLDPFVLSFFPGAGIPVTYQYPCAGSPCPFSTTPPPAGPGPGLFVCSDPCPYVWFSTDVRVFDDPPGAVDTRTVEASVRKLMTETLHTMNATATISNVAPTITVDAIPSVVAGTQAIVNGNLEDPGTDDGTLHVNWGDSEASSVAYIFDGAFQVRHTYATPGTRIVSVRAVDDDGGESATVNRVVVVTPATNGTPVTRAPAAPLAAAEDGSLQIDLRDFIVSDDLTAVADLAVAVTDPAHGSLSGSGFLRTYTPDADHHGADSFDLTVTDGGAPTGCSPVGPSCVAPASSTLSVPIAVSPVNDVPVVELSGPAAASEGGAPTFTFTVADVDAGDGIASGSVVATCGAAGTVVSGSLQVGASGGSFACTFPDGAATSAVQVTLTDLAGATAGDTIEVQIANVAPTVQANVSPASHVALPTETVTVAGSFTDPGADTGTVTVAWGDGTSTTLPAQAPGTFRATHAYVTSGARAITVTVADGETSSSRTYQLLVAAGAAAVEEIADRLADAPTSGLTASQRRALREAVDRLIGPNGGAGVGAADQMVSDPVAALDKIAVAVGLLAAVPIQEATTARLRLAEVSQGVAVEALAAAKQRTGCASYSAPSCSRGEATALRAAEVALVVGNLALAQGSALVAVAAYRDATSHAVRA